MKRNTLVTGAVVGALFIAGVVTGILVAPLVPGEAPWVSNGSGADATAEAPEGTASHEPPESGDEEQAHRRRGPVYALARLLHEELELTTEQEHRVEEILERRRESASRLFRDVRERFRAELETTVEELKVPLTEEQAARFQRLIDEMRERWHDREDRRESPSP